MATSAEQLQDAIDRMTALANVYDGKKQEIDASVQAALDAAPDIRKIIWVNQANGDDTNDGTASLLVASIQEAVSRGSDGYGITIRIQGLYNVTTAESINYLDTIIIGENGEHLSFAAVNTDVSSEFVPGIVGHNWALMTRIYLRNLTLTLWDRKHGKNGSSKRFFQGSEHAVYGDEQLRDGERGRHGVEPDLPSWRGGFVHKKRHRSP